MVKASFIIKNHVFKEIRKWWNVEGNVTYPSVFIVYHITSYVRSIKKFQACISQTYGKKQGQAGELGSEEPDEVQQGQVQGSALGQE